METIEEVVREGLADCIGCGKDLQLYWDGDVRGGHSIYIFSRPGSLLGVSGILYTCSDDVCVKKAEHAAKEIKKTFNRIKKQ